MNKVCPKCNKQNKFSKNKARKDGLDSWCVLCMAELHKRYYKNNPEKCREKKDKFRVGHPTYAREYCLRTKYGLTEDLFRKILKFQGGRCAICRINKPGGRYAVWSVDHCHTGNFVRGLLCFNCNKHLGFYERISEQIIEYLKDPPAMRVLKGELNGLPLFKY